MHNPRRVTTMSGKHKKHKRHFASDFVIRPKKPTAPKFVRTPPMPVPRSLRMAYHIESDEAVDMAVACGLPAPDGYKRLMAGNRK